MAKRFLFYGALLIGAYLGLSHATEGGKLLTAGQTFLSGTVKTFQGR